MVTDSNKDVLGPGNAWQDRNRRTGGGKSCSLNLCTLHTAALGNTMATNSLEVRCMIPVK